MSIVRKLLHRGPKRPAVTVDTTWAQPFTLGPGDELEVVGESHYQRALERAAQGRTPDGCKVPLVTAELVREPGNRHDPNAVRVDIGGYTVGYVPADLAPDTHPIIDHLWAHGYAATCRAMLTGGWDRGWRDKGHIGCILDVGHPIDTFRPERHPFFPDAKRVSVTGEQHHQDVLEAVIGEHRKVDALSHLELDGDIIRVQIDGHVIGELTAKMSARYAPLLRHASTCGVALTSRGLVARGERKVEAYVYLPNEPDRLTADSAQAQWS